MTYSEITKESPLVLVEFFATWCPHCQRMMPVVAEVKKELEGVAQVVQLDVDKEQEFANEAGVQGIPTFIVYKEGKEMWRQSGEMEGSSLLEAVRKFA